MLWIDAGLDLWVLAHWSGAVSSNKGRMEARVDAARSSWEKLCTLAEGNWELCWTGGALGVCEGGERLRWRVGVRPHRGMHAAVSVRRANSDVQMVAAVLTVMLWWR